MATRISAKHLQIDKANARVVVSIAVASFIVAFSLVSTRALLNQRSYHSRVIAEKQKAVKQLEANVKAATSLVASYDEFVQSPENIIGGNPAGTGEKDGDNAKIILDALPSVYDFPALTTSIEKILTGNGFKMEAINGTDDELNQKDLTSPVPAPVDMPFTVTVSTNYASIENLMKIFERSIRPMQIQSIDLTGSDTQIRATISAKTFYQPGKNLTITTQAVQ